jgi:hypothetical protein
MFLSKAKWHVFNILPNECRVLEEKARVTLTVGGLES